METPHPTRTQAWRCGNNFTFATVFFYPTIQCNCSACNVPPDAGLQKISNFSPLIVRLAWTGDQTWAGGQHSGGITLAFWMCSLDVRFTLECVFDVIFEFLTLNMTSKMYLTVKRTSKLHIQKRRCNRPLTNCAIHYDSFARSSSGSYSSLVQYHFLR
jgi:hypothetical protein